MSTRPNRSHESRTPTRRAFLASAALPLAAASAASSATQSDTCHDRDTLLDAARHFSALIPEWTEAARALIDHPGESAPQARFDAVDRLHDAAKRHLLHLMRASGCPVVIDRPAALAYLDATPSGSHEDLDHLMPTHSVVKVVPLKLIAGLN